MKKLISVILLLVMLYAIAPAEESTLDTLDIAAGDIVIFGHYEQDNDQSNGPEPIEWIVLDVQDGKTLLLSKYGLDVKPYNTEFTEVTWETCALRSWLNDEFLNAAFGAEEQAAILITEVNNSTGQSYSGWNTTGGNNTQDKIFLLSYAEANRYLDVKHWRDDDGNNTKARVAPTEYAIKNGALTSDSNQTEDGNPAGWWWLRSPGDFQHYATDVGYDGSLADGDVDSDNGCVRPALWIDLDSGIF